MIQIRDATAGESSMLEALQRRASDIWEAYRGPLAANPDAITLPESFIERGWVRVGVARDDTPLGFSVVIPIGDAVHEVDGLFVEPDHMRRGVGRALVEDAATRARDSAAACLEVTAGPAAGFYERLGFTIIGEAKTRFGPAVRMRRDLPDVDSGQPPKPLSDLGNDEAEAPKAFRPQCRHRRRPPIARPHASSSGPSSSIRSSA